MLSRARLGRQALAAASRTLLASGGAEAPARLAANRSNTGGVVCSSALLAACAAGRALRSAHRGRSASSSAPAEEAVEAGEGVQLTDEAVQRLHELVQEDSSKPVLRISVSAGGCSGFQYQFELVEGAESDDRIFERDGATVVADDVSYSFIKGSKIHFEEDLIRSAFVIADNPVAESSCGCGSSFAAKN